VNMAGGLLDWLRGADTLEAIVIGDIRLPRTLLAICVGAALGLSGAALQGLLRNPLADPGLIGASQGAALGAAAVFYFGLLSFAGEMSPALAGLLGAGIALVLMLALAGSSRPSMVIMAGLAISTISGAGPAIVLTFAPTASAMRVLVCWLLVSVSVRWLALLCMMVRVLLTGGVLFLRQRALPSGLAAGERPAQTPALKVVRGSRLVDR